MLRQLLYYYGLLATVVQSVRWLLRKSWTMFGLVMSLFICHVSAFNMTQQDSMGVLDVISDGFLMTVLTSDIILAKMAGHELHPWVIGGNLGTVFHFPTTMLALTFIYYAAIFGDFCWYLNLLLLATCRNVYVDGFFDMCHIGHKRAFQRALALGNRLFVGMINDKDASQYKHPPIMSLVEWCAKVEACKAVTKAILNALFLIYKEYIKEHQIHVVSVEKSTWKSTPIPRMILL